MNQPIITVLMPVYNAERYLKEAIESILDQSYGNFIFLIINDGSKDRSGDIINSYDDERIHVINHEKNVGLVATLNEGLAKSNTELIARMDADDISEKDRIAKQIAYMKKHNNVLALGTGMKIIDQSGATLGYEPGIEKSEAIRRCLAVRNVIAHPSIVMRKSAVLKVGGYDPSSTESEDYELWLKLSDLGELSNINEPLIKYRVSKSSKSQKNISATRNFAAKYADCQWAKFGSEGPAPRQDWKEIWMDDTSDNTKNSRNFYSQLHIFFSIGYRKRNDYKRAAQHLIAAMGQNFNIKQLYYVFMLIMPSKLFKAIDNKLAKILTKTT